jgi:hypothetical protein
LIPNCAMPREVYHEALHCASQVAALVSDGSNRQLSFRLLDAMLTISPPVDTGPRCTQCRYDAGSSKTAFWKPQNDPLSTHLKYAGKCEDTANL